MDTTIKKPDKKSLLYLAIVLAAALLVFAGLLYYLFRTPKIEIPEEKEETLEEILERLTPAESKPLTAEEKKEQEELSKQLTPVKPKPMTEEEKKEMEELLKKLTP